MTPPLEQRAAAAGVDTPARPGLFPWFLGKVHRDGTESAVDVGYLTGDSGGEIRAQERRGVADVLDRDIALDRRHSRDVREHLAQPGHAGRAQGLDRPRGYGIDADSAGPQVRRQKA